MALATGTRLGAYEVTGSLGAGGMGEVYRATDLKLGREVAIKTLPVALAQDRDRLARIDVIVNWFKELRTRAPTGRSSPHRDLRRAQTAQTSQIVSGRGLRPSMSVNP